MKQKGAIQMLNLAGRACIFLTLAFAGTAVAENSKPPVSIGVYAQHTVGKIAYHYHLVNNSPQDIVAVAIGLNNQNDGVPANDVYELVELPSGWNSKVGIPTTSAGQPTGWRASVMAPDEESKTHAISWETLNVHSPKILSGQAVNKMSITLDKPDNNYLTCHALVTYAEGDPIRQTVPVERLDRTPPEFTVNLSPNTILSQDNKLVAINATFTLKDDYDHMPEIKLESVTSNEPLGADDIRDASIGLDDRYFKLRAESKSPSGRVYTVIYSATDATGNQSLASATVTVVASHNQAEKLETKRK